MAFQYKKRSAEAVDKRATQQGGGFKGFIKDEFKTYTPKKGDNWIRILPPTWENPEHYGYDVWAHYSVGPEKASVVCNLKQEGKRCPVCEAKVKLETDDAPAELIADHKPNKRVLVWMLDMKDEDKGPQIWAMPWTIDRDIAKICKDRRTGEIYAIDDPDDGYDIFFDREGENRTTKYAGFQLNRKPSSIADKHLDFVVANPLPECILFRDYAEVQHLYTGGADEEEASPRSRRSTPQRPSDEEEAPRSRRGRDSDDDAERPRRQIDREEEETPKSRRAPVEEEEAPRSRRAAPVEDDDPAPRSRRSVPRDDEEPEPAPRRRAAPVEDDEPAPRGRKRDEVDDDEIPFTKDREEPPPAASGKSRAEMLRQRLKERG